MALPDMKFAWEYPYNTKNECPWCGLDITEDICEIMDDTNEVEFDCARCDRPLHVRSEISFITYMDVGDEKFDELIAEYEKEVGQKNA